MPFKYEFKPCPFCGSNIIRLLPQEWGYSVNCEICSAKIRVHIKSKGKNKKAAYIEWNMRREPFPIQSNEKSLKELIDRNNKEL